MTTPRTALDELIALVRRCPELNLFNYTSEEVSALNDWAVEVHATLDDHGKALSEALGGWLLIDTAPKDGTLIDIWCISPNDDYAPEGGGIRLTDVAWHESSDIFPHTGWVRLTDDGNYDLIDSKPTCRYGLPRWLPVKWRPLPPPPTSAKGSEVEGD